MDNFFAFFDALPVGAQCSLTVAAAILILGVCVLLSDAGNEW
jgi:hypothetical protein